MTLEKTCSSKTCVGWVRNNPLQAKRTLIGAMLIGVFGGLAILFGIYKAKAYVESIRPEPPVIDQIIVSPRDAHGSIKVRIRFSTSPTKNCLRIGSHMILPFPADVDEPDFDLMPGSLAGEGFGSRTAVRFVTTFYFPSAIEAGTYDYTYRRFMQCNPWNLVPFQDQVTAKIVIP